jgi:WD40 repeat protein
MLISHKEHRGAVTCLQVNRDNTQCVSGSADGSCIVWDLERGVRMQAMFEPNVFKSIVYHPDESQYLTCGSNHKITYWDAYDGSAIRVIVGGEEEMNALDVEENGEWFVSGGDDALVKVWHYDDGIPTGMGKGHSGRITSVRVSPDKRTIVSVGEEGGIFIWSAPESPEHELNSEPAMSC